MKKEWKILVSVSIALLAVVLFAGCAGNKVKNTESTSGSKIKVVATVYPVYEFVKQVGGDKVDVVMLIPPGAEPHDWEPTAKDITRLKDAKIFAYHGSGFEPVEKLLTKDVLGTTVPVQVSKGVAKLADHHDEDKHKKDDHHKEDKHDHEGDSHMWLDPLAAQQEVNNILTALIAADEKNAAYYKENAEKFNKQLSELDQEYKQTLSTIARKDIITSHEAFGYLAARYGLNQVGIMGLSPDAEPTPDKMAEITKFCREHNVKYIFFETLASPKLAQTIAKETGAELLVLNPVENLTEEEMKQGKNYIMIMRENLTNLVKALK
ncbi:metal ABC transporter substrate-binding protein [Pelosinus sp. sgz500959]|uniref:metal ABC transporter substrate-binding protein n=1 Tax=Pelosinus sp. sgz500959 TaxID=3242472 RepID=UPI00367251AB